MGVYTKLLKKHYTPPQRQTPAPQIQQTSGNQEPIKNENQENLPLPMKTSDDAMMRRPDDPTTRRSGDTTKRRPGEETTRRKIKRESMNFYEDQIQYLRTYSLQEKIKGKQLGVSEMIRDAIDRYIEKIKEKK